MRFPIRLARPDKTKAATEGHAPGRKERQFLENTLRVPLHKFADRKAYLEVGCKRVWASFRACHITASILLSTRFQIQGISTNAEVEDTELTRLLTSPNPHDSWEELIYLWVFHMKLTGVAFWYKSEMDYTGKPKHLYPMMPQFMAVVPHEKDMISHYIYRVNGKETRFERDEIIMFKRPHPMKATDGLGDIEPSESIFSEYIMRGNMEKKFLANGAMPSGILMKEETVEDQPEWDKLKAWWKAEYEGERNVGKTAFLNGKWSYTKLGLTHAEMQSIENEKWSIEQILTNHGVPHSLAGLDKAANLATARQDEINFRKYEIVPLLDILVGKLNAGGDEAGSHAFVRAYNVNWEIAYELSGLIDVEQTVKEYRPLVVEGAMSLNELRELCGLEAIDNPLLDQHFIGSSRVPLELAGYVEPPPDDIEVIEEGEPADPKLPKTEEELQAKLDKLGDTDPDRTALLQAALDKITSGV